MPFSNRTTVGAARKVTTTYDARNRLLKTAFGDASPAIDRTYWPVRRMSRR